MKHPPVAQSHKGKRTTTSNTNTALAVHKAYKCTCSPASPLSARRPPPLGWRVPYYAPFPFSSIPPPLPPSCPPVPPLAWCSTPLLRCRNRRCSAGVSAPPCAAEKEKKRGLRGRLVRGDHGLRRRGTTGRSGGEPAGASRRRRSWSSASVFASKTICPTILKFW